MESIFCVSDLKLRVGLNALSQLILGANSLMQSVLPKLLLETPNDFYKNTLQILQVGSY